MGYEQLQNIINENRLLAELHPIDQDLENNICPDCAWELSINKEGEKSCPICGRIYV